MDFDEAVALYRRQVIAELENPRHKSGAGIPGVIGMPVALATYPDGSARDSKQACYGCAYDYGEDDESLDLLDVYDRQVRVEYPEVLVDTVEKRPVNDTDLPEKVARRLMSAILTGERFAPYWRYDVPAWLEAVEAVPWSIIIDGQAVPGVKLDNAALDHSIAVAMLADCLVVIIGPSAAVSSTQLVMVQPPPGWVPADADMHSNPNA